MTISFKPRITEKRWDISEEERLYKLWEEEGLHKFVFREDDDREIIAIDTPPPYASGKWHVGGAAHYAQIDMVARYFRMKGYNVLVPFYADRNGLPVEVQVEKAYGINPHEVSRTPEGRERFLELCREFLDKTEEEIVGIWKRLGCSFDYWRNGTDSPEYRRITQATFIELYRRGLVYEAERPVNWCPRCRTTLADAELEHKEVRGYLYYIRFTVKEDGRELVIATTRPELLRACKAVIYHPDDDRYRGLEGLHAVVPLYNHIVPIKTHREVDPRFGTGLVMVCSYGDQADIKMFRELGLEPIVIIDRDGRLKEGAGPIAGLSVEEARRRIAGILEEKGLIVKKEELVHSIPVCWRCKTPVQFIHTREWFLKQLGLKDELRKLVLEKIEFKPLMHRRKLLDWIDSISTDWPISRDRYYATEVPIWRCSKCGAILVPEPGRYYRPWIDEPPWSSCPECGAPRESLVGEKKVFDTWFDSSITVLYVTGYLRDNKLFKKAFKYTLRPQGQDIIRTWLYYSILRVYQLLGKPAFKWVRITGMGLDEKGEAMHKSKGNVIDPEPFLRKYGADAFRFWSAASSKLGYDYRFSEQMIRTGLLFTTKLWNIARFISSFPKPETRPRLRPIDKATLARLAYVLERVDKAYSELDVYEPVNEIYQFTWNYFASNYLELVKTRAYNSGGRYGREEQEAAWYTLHTVLDNILRALAPIMPFITDALYRRLYGRCIHREAFPKPDSEWLEWSPELTDLVMEANSAIWSFKKKRNIKFKEPLEYRIYLPEKLKPIKEELVDLHKLVDIEFYSMEKPVGLEIGAGIVIVEK